METGRQPWHRTLTLKARETESLSDHCGVVHLSRSRKPNFKLSSIQAKTVRPPPARMFFLHGLRILA